MKELWKSFLCPCVTIGPTSLKPAEGARTARHLHSHCLQKCSWESTDFAATSQDKRLCKSWKSCTAGRKNKTTFRSSSASCRCSRAQCRAGVRKEMVVSCGFQITTDNIQDCSWPCDTISLLLFSLKVQETVMPNGIETGFGETNWRHHWWQGQWLEYFGHIFLIIWATWCLCHLTVGYGSSSLAARLSNPSACTMGLSFSSPVELHIVLCSTPATTQALGRCMMPTFLVVPYRQASGLIAS